MAPARIADLISEPSGTTLPSYAPVLIVGAGPVGLLQAYLLSRLNIKSIVIERYGKRLLAPKAHALSSRSLELCRQFGLNTNEIRRRGTSRKDAYWVNFLTNLSEPAVGRLPYERMDKEVLQDTPEMIHNIPQPIFEEIIAEELRDDPNVAIFKNMSFISCREKGGEVYTTIEDRMTGAEVNIKSRHVIGCDGARSKVRACLGIETVGEDGYDTMMTIHFNADLRPIVGERVGMLHWSMDPQVSGFIIGYDLGGNQVLICNFDSKRYPLPSWNEALCRKTVDAALGCKAQYDILSWRPWVLSRKVAKAYRKGAVFLAGDAAHSFPPTGGLGLNCGVADVHNLAYKIAAVQQGWGNDTLLDTYEDERQHVAFVYSSQSVKNGKKIFSFLRALGANGEEPDSVRENLYRTIRDPANAKMIQAHIEGQREHFDNLGLHIGYVYGRKTIPENASIYTAEFIRGARLPHAWIKFTSLKHTPALPPTDVSYVSEFSCADASTRQYSTLDLCEPDSFTMFVGSSTFTSEELCSIEECFGRALIPIKVSVLGRDFEVVNESLGGKWVHSLYLNDGGICVVRPDQHILHVFDKKVAEDSILRVVAQHLGL